MGVGVETRMPFLDVRLIETVMALRLHNPDHNLGQKSWLRAALKGVLPDEILARPKAGFQPPVNEWLAGAVNTYSHILEQGQLVQSGIIAADQVGYIRKTLPQQGNAALFLAYKFVLLEMWYQKVVMH